MALNVLNYKRFYNKRFYNNAFYLGAFWMPSTIGILYKSHGWVFQKTTMSQGFLLCFFAASSLVNSLMHTILSRAGYDLLSLGT